MHTGGNDRLTKNLNFSLKKMAKLDGWKWSLSIGALLLSLLRLSICVKLSTSVNKTTGVLTITGKCDSISEEIGEVIYLRKGDQYVGAYHINPCKVEEICISNDNRNQTLTVKHNEVEIAEFVLEPLPHVYEEPASSGWSHDGMTSTLTVKISPDVHKASLELIPVNATGCEEMTIDGVREEKYHIFTFDWRESDIGCIYNSTLKEKNQCGDVTTPYYLSNKTLAFEESTSTTTSSQGIVGYPSSTEESPDLNSTEESPDLNSTKESPDLNSTEESPDLNSTKESPDLNSTEESPDLNSTEESPDMNSTEAGPDLNEEESSDLSTGSIIGIVVAVAIAAGVVFILYNRRRRGYEAANPGDGIEMKETGVHTTGV